MISRSTGNQQEETERKTGRDVGNGDGSNGLLADFLDLDGLAEKVLAVLRDPRAFCVLGQRGLAMIHKRYALDVTLPKLIQWLERTCAGNLP
jgi:hypothetical protein